MVTSVQNRLISAREQITAKSKDNYEFNVSKCGMIKKPPICECKEPIIFIFIYLMLFF